MTFPFNQLRSQWPPAVNAAYTQLLYERGWGILQTYTAGRLRQERRPFIRDLLWDWAVDVLLYGVRWFEPALGRDSAFEAFLVGRIRLKWGEFLKAQKRQAEPVYQEPNEDDLRRRVNPDRHTVSYRLADIAVVDDSDPADQATTAEFYRHHMQTLAPTDRTVLGLWLRGETFEEIGRQCGYTKQGAYVIQQRALGRIQRQSSS